MKRRLLSLFLVLSLALSLVLIPASADDGAPQPKQASTVQAVYLGVQDYGTVTSKRKKYLYPPVQRKRLCSGLSGLRRRRLRPAEPAG